MKLQRRFDWKDRESVYHAIDETEVEKATEGRVRFNAIRISDGNIYEGVSYPTTVAQMVDTKTGFWRLAANPKNADKSVVVEARPSSVTSETVTEKALSENKPRTGKHKGD